MVMGSIFTMALCAVILILTVGMLAYAEIVDGKYWDALGMVFIAIPFLGVILCAGLTFAGLLK